ncbi:MAG: SDR family NAD(P)-dependent oxidoreductase [Patescibacteria group bacterium]|jgi:NAD(P)-dependent dehydrogenase (short-subunit alcohol dehydrogenase family)
MKTVLITGISRGIGRALAEKFLENGDVVIGTSRTGSVDFVHENLTVIGLELTAPASIEACAKSVQTLGKKIDIFINNAGVWDEGDDTEEVNIPALRRTLEVNLIAPIAFTEQILQLVNRRGHIVNISSRRGSLANLNDTKYPSYSISKTALNMFTRLLAVRLEGRITVSSVHPGSVKTDMNPDGKISAQESADDIFKLANSDVETGQFWFKGEKMAW